MRACFERGGVLISPDKTISVLSTASPAYMPYMTYVFKVVLARFVPPRIRRRQGANAVASAVLARRTANLGRERGSGFVKPSSPRNAKWPIS